MKVKINKKGFTMVELLAAIVILGLLSGIGITAVSKIIEKSKINYYKTEKNTMLEAGQTYVENNRELLPKNVGEVKTYKLQDLYKAKVLTEKLTDENGDTCIANDSTFYVYKESSTEYKYSAILVCPSCKNKNNCDSVNGNKMPKDPVIEFSKCNGSYKNPPVATIELTGSEDEVNPLNIASYSYKIFKDGVNVYSSEAIRTKEKSYLKFKVNLTKYVPASIKIEVTVTNVEGYTTTTSADAPTDSNEGGKYCKDYISVDCGSFNYESVEKTYKPLEDNQTSCNKVNSKNKNDWLNADDVEGRKVWVKCDSKDGTDCKEPVYSGTYTMDSTSKKITISDTENNSRECTVATCIDKTYPTIVAKIYKRSSNGNASGEPLYTYDITGTKNVKETLNKVTEWINYDTAPNGIVIKVEASDKTSGIDTSNFYYQTKATKKNEITEKSLSYNAAEYIKGTTKTITLTDSGYQQYRFVVKDIAGNTSTLEFAIKFDNVKPTISSLTYKKANGTSYDQNWYNNDVTANASVSDDISGIYSQTFYKDKKESDTTTSNYWTGTSSFSFKYTDEGNYTSKFKVCDVAGNCTTSSNETIKIDKTKPTCTISFDGTSGDNNWFKSKNVTVSMTKADDPPTSNIEASGIDTYGLNVGSASANSKTKDTQTDTDNNGKTWYCYVKDKAGNVYTSNKWLKVDTQKPTCTNSGGSSSWTNSNVTITGKCTDNGNSGCTGDASKTYSSNTDSDSETPGTIKDYAGNSTTCASNRKVHIDKSKPNVSLSVTTQKSGYNSTTATLKVTGTDNYNSGIAGYCYRTTNDSSGCSWSSSSISKTVTVSSSYNGNSKTYYAFTKDKAGNVSSVASQTYKVYTSCSKTKGNGNSGWGSCDTACGSGTKYITYYYKDKYLDVDCPSETKSSSCTGTNCNLTLKTCRNGNTCMHSSLYACHYAISQGQSFEVKQVGDNYIIQSGSYAGNWFKVGCLNSSGSCNFDDCPG